MVPVSTTSSSTSSSDLTLTQSIASSIFFTPLVKLATGGKLGVFPGGSQSVQQSSPVPSTTTIASKITASSSTSNGSSTSSNTNTTEISSSSGSGGNVSIPMSAIGGIAQSTGIEATAPSTANTNAPSGGLTREMAEQLAKKLNAAELTAIKALSDLLRKQTGQMATLREDKELVETKLQVGIYIYVYIYGCFITLT
jgi:hypothetical protein